LNRFNKAVCTMAVMDMPEIGPLFTLLSRVLTAGGAFVFSVAHPCFHSAAIQEGPRFPDPEQPRAAVGWRDMPDIPPIMVVRMKLLRT
jgi:hypothetical protein